jgi:hypothetical protein
MKVPKINPADLKQSFLARELYKIIAKWCKMAASSYKKWEKRPGCGYFFNGVYNYAIDNSATAIVTAVVCSTGDYDEAEIGIPVDELRKMTVGAIRYLCFTHYTGPEDCVMEKSRNPVTSNKEWGYTPGNFFMTSQTGVSVSMIGLAAWLMWDELDLETRNMVAKVLEFYADEYCEMKPGTGVYNDTQCEENAWTSLGIAAALYMFPEHPHSDKWLDGYIRWSLNTITTFKDKLSNEHDKVTGFSRNGFSYNKKIYGISSVTFHPDLTTENHGYVHPDYMGGGIILRISSSVFPLLLGKEPPESLLYNMKELYDHVLKPWCGFDGNPIPVQGQDWFYHKHANKLLIHATMNLFFNDGDAAMFERKCIDITAKRQEFNGNGRLIERDGEKLDVTPGLQSAFDMEYGAIRTIVLSYLLHLLKGDGSEPSDEKTVMDKLSGIYSYPYGGAYIYRTPDSFSSFTTRCSIMGLTVPKNGLWDITADFQSYTGIIREKTRDDGYFKNKKVNWTDIGIEAKRLETNIQKDGFSVTAAVPRAGGAVMQKTSFSALPDGKTVFIEKSTAVRSVEIETYETGRISIGNENYPPLGEYAKGYRDIFINSKQARFYGSYGGSDKKINVADVERVNIDSSMGYLVYGSNGTEYINRHEYPKWKGLEDTLVLNKTNSFSLEQGEETGLFSIVSLPNSSDKETKREQDSTSVTIYGNNIIIIRNMNSRVSVNFSDDDEAVIDDNPLQGNSISIFSGKTTVSNGSAVNEYILKGFSTRVEKIKGSLIMNEIPEEFDIICTETDITFINPTQGDLIYKAAINGNENSVFHPAGDTICIPLDTGM